MTRTGPRDPLADEPRLRLWRQWTDWPLTGLAALFLVLYAVQVLHVSASPETKAWVEGGIWGLWSLFACDYGVRFWLARRKLAFVVHHPFDLLVVVLPMLRPLRVLRVLAVISSLNRRLVDSLHQRVALYSTGATALIGSCASLAVLDAEREAAGATITTFPDALWWTLTTITTVGYGDLYPVTSEGRLVAAMLMVGGIALLGVVTGLVASWFVRMFKGAEESAAERAEALLRVELAEVKAELRAIRETIG